MLMGQQWSDNAPGVHFGPRRQWEMPCWSFWIVCHWEGTYALVLGEDSHACEASQGSTPGSHSCPGHRHKPAHTFSSEAVWSIKREDLVAISPSCVCTVILFSSDLNMFFFVPFPLVRKTLWGKLDDSELFWAWIRIGGPCSGEGLECSVARQSRSQ